MEMVHELEERGCTPVKAVDELTDDTTLVIRSHGVEKSVIDSLVKRGINFEDATCPFVKKIHKIVSNTNPENDVVLIAGNKNHPEVCGIIGHCASNCYTFNNEAELDDLLPNILKENNKQVQIVAQTTFDTQEWKKCVKKIKKLSRIRAVPVADYNHKVGFGGNLRSFGLPNLRSITYCIKYFCICT